MYKLFEDRVEYQPFEFPDYHKAGWLTQQQAHWLHTELPMQGDIKDWNEKINLYNFLENKTDRETQAYIADDIFYRYDKYINLLEKCSSRNQVQLRHPLINDELIEFVLNLGQIKLQNVFSQA